MSQRATSVTHTGATTAPQLRFTLLPSREAAELGALRLELEIAESNRALAMAFIIPCRETTNPISMAMNPDSTIARRPKESEMLRASHERTPTWIKVAPNRRDMKTV